MLGRWAEENSVGEKSFIKNKWYEKYHIRTVLCTLHCVYTSLVVSRKAMN